MSKLKVFLANRGNIDFGQDPTKSIYGTWSDYHQEVKDEQEASEVCRKYIEKENIGGGAWVGGQIFKDGEMIAYVSYNGKVWGKDIKYFEDHKKLYERVCH